MGGDCPEGLPEGWHRIYYQGGQIWDSREAQPGPCPLCGQPGQVLRPPEARGVQVILEASGAVGWAMQSGSDYYVRAPGPSGGPWLGVDIFGLFDWLLSSGLFLAGRTITNAEYQAIYQQAKADRGLVDKGGFLPPRLERVPRP